jgi:hypothetical protein
MPLKANFSRSYKGDGVKPIVDSDRQVRLPVPLAAGASFTGGQTLGQVTGSGSDVNEVQSLIATSASSGGFQLMAADGQKTVTIAFNASAATIQTALEGILGGSGNVTCTGGPLPGTAVVITYLKDCGALSQPLLQVVNSTLVGGTAVVTRTTAGKPANGYFAAYNDALSDGTQVNKAVLQYDCSVDQFGLITFGQTPSGMDMGGAERQAPAWFTGIFKGSDLIGIDANGVADVGRIIMGSTLSSAYTLVKFH